MAARVVSYGEIDLDVYLALSRLPALNQSAAVTEEFENVGGAAANTALWLAHWGIRTTLLGHDLGDDRYGDAVRAVFAGTPHLDARYVGCHPNYRTPRCQCLVTPDGERSFIMHWLDELRLTRLQAAMLKGAEWLNLDMSGPLPPRLEAARLAKAQRVRVLVNDVYESEHPLLPLVDIVVISASIVRSRLPATPPLELAARLQAAGGCSVVVTDGGAPLHALLADGAAVTVQPPAVEVVDTTGAGDIFKAGLLYGLLAGLPLEQALVWGVAAGSVMATVAGTTAQVAPLAEVRAVAAQVQARIE